MHFTINDITIDLRKDRESFTYNFKISILETFLVVSKINIPLWAASVNKIRLYIALIRIGKLFKKNFVLSLL
jgi:hypothetical protein